MYDDNDQTSGSVRESRACFVPFVQDISATLVSTSSCAIYALYVRKKREAYIFHKRRPTHLFRKIQVVEAFHDVHELVDGPR